MYIYGVDIPFDDVKPQQELPAENAAAARSELNTPFANGFEYGKSIFLDESEHEGE